MSLVQIRMSDEVLRQALRLPDGVTLHGAGIERSPVHGFPPSLVLALDAPDAPDGAVAAEPVYAHSGHRDPVELTGMRWYRADGSEIEPGHAEKQIAERGFRTTTQVVEGM